MRPLYRIEGDANRRGDGLYDKMRNLGAHEIVVESPEHRL
jgi:UDPglucose--hexose-1-phosphate uridylyltransferase